MVESFSFTQVHSRYMYQYAQKTLGTTLETSLYSLANASNEAQFYQNFSENQQLL